MNNPIKMGKTSEQILHKENIDVLNEYVKKYSTSFVIRDM